MIHEIAKLLKMMNGDIMDALCKYFFPRIIFECLLLKTVCLDPLKFLC